MPTVSEAGVPGYEASSWWGVLAPARTPREIVTKLHADIVKVLQMPDTRNRFMNQGGDPVGSTPEQFAGMIRDELAKWAKLVKEANIKID